MTSESPAILPHTQKWWTVFWDFLTARVSTVCLTIPVLSDCHKLSIVPVTPLAGGNTPQYLEFKLALAEKPQNILRLEFSHTC